MVFFRIVCLVLIAASIAVFGTSGELFFTGSYEAGVATPTTTAAKRDVKKILMSQGRIRCQVFANKCPLEGSGGKLIEIAKHGSYVNQGDVVARFDPVQIAEVIKRKRAEFRELQVQVATNQYDYDIQLNENESEISTARYELEIAELTLKKYVESDTKIQKLTQEGSIAEANANLEKSRQEQERTMQLVKKGYRTAKQLQEMKKRLVAATAVLKQEEQRLRALVDFEFGQKKYELSSKVSEAKDKLKFAKSNGEFLLTNIKMRLNSSREKLAAVQKQLTHFESQLELCEMRAPQSGIFSRCLSARGFQIEKEDALVHRQDVFYFVDRKKLLVRFPLQSAEASLVSPGMWTGIQVHGFPDRLFFGQVKSLKRGRIETECDVTIDDIPDDVVLNPGMEASVMILTSHQSDVIGLPFMSVAKHEDDHYVFQKVDGVFDAKKVELGISGDDYTEVKSGIEVGAEVALDASALAESLLQSKDDESDDEPSR